MRISRICMNRQNRILVGNRILLGNPLVSFSVSNAVNIKYLYQLTDTRSSICFHILYYLGVTNEVINGAINISSPEQAVLAAIRKKPRITKMELQKETSFGKSTIDRAIKALKEKCLIKRVGTN